MPAALAAATAVRMSGSSGRLHPEPLDPDLGTDPVLGAQPATSPENRVTNGPTGSPKAFQ